MQKRLTILAVLPAFLLAAFMAGCTLYGPKNPPTLASTTSAEQHERILWQMVQKQQWEKIGPLFSTTLVWDVNGKALASDQVVPYLKSLNLKDAVVSNASIQPNGPDMTVSYTLQLSADAGALQQFSVLSVWQQLKNGGYVLIAHSQQPQPGTSTTASAQ
jgi:outer membrane PBP1 activator LpoA protein